MDPELPPPPYARITTGIETADEFKAVIDDYTAKLIAETVVMSADSVTKNFAATGAIDLDTMLAEIHDEAARKGVSDFEKKMYNALGTYAITAAGEECERGPVVGWHDLVDTGPDVPPGYIGTYSSLNEGLRALGIRALALADGRWHLFHNPEGW